MVLFLFVIMLLNLGDKENLKEIIGFKKLTAILLSLLLMCLLGFTVFAGFYGKFDKMSENSLAIGTAESLGKELTTTYSLPFELASFLLLAGIIGAVVLAKKKFE